MRAHIVENNTIINTVEVGSVTDLPNLIEAVGQEGIGWYFESGVWNQPEVVVGVPKEVTMRQARLALLENSLLANVQPAINSLPEPDKTKAQIEWEYSNALQRGNPFVAVLGAALGLSSQDLDDLFIQAAAL